MSGYSVRVGRATSPLGPFVDQNGASLNTFNPCGYVAIAANGNRWIGPGGNVVFAGYAGQEYMLHNPVDLNAPYFDGYPGITRPTGRFAKFEDIEVFSFPAAENRIDSLCTTVSQNQQQRASRQLQQNSPLLCNAF